MGFTAAWNMVKSADLDTYLKLGQFAADATAKSVEYQETVILRQQQFHAAREQAAFNNQLLYNSYTNLNEQEQLEYKKHAINQFELQAKVRRAVATRLAIQGSANKSGGSAESIIMNIQRQGLYASHRKDFNYEIRIRNLQTQRANEALATQSKNNALYNSLQGFPSATGLALSIGGSALQRGSEWQSGRITGKADKTPSPAPKTSPAPKKRNAPYGGYTGSMTPSGDIADMGHWK